MRARLVLAASGFAAVTVLASGDVAAQLAPHRAFYELTLADRSSTLVDAEGAFAIEWRAHCEGFASQQRLWFVGRIEGGGTLDYDVRFSTWESADGRVMRFTMRSFQGGELVEEFRGRARMPEDDGPGRAVYTVPADVEMTLPPDTVFPTRHLERLIELAAAGERMASFELFDGAGIGGDALTFVTAVIGDPAGAREPAASGRAWPMSLAYHALPGAESEAPIFELSFELADDGIMRDVLLDYGAFALRARLAEIERLTRPSCAP